MKKIVLATTNKGKLEEFNNMAKKYDIEFITIDMPEIEENGSTFEENSLIKAKEISKICNLPVVADDSGLCVVAMDNKPGIHTARYRQDLGAYDKRCKALIDELNEKETENRSAFFVCVITIVLPDGTYKHFRGESYGKITNELKGNNGHGYDPIFYNEEYNKTFAEMTIDEKSKVSHRAKAFELLEDFLNEYIKL